MRLLSTDQEADGLSQGHGDSKYTGDEAGEIFEIVGGFEHPTRVASDDERTLFFLDKDGSGYLYLHEHDDDSLSKLLVYGSNDSSGAEAAERLFERLVGPDGLDLDELIIAQGDIYPAA